MTKDTLSKPKDIELLDFKYFPKFATYVLNNRLNEYILKQIEHAREVNMPMMHHFVDYSDPQLLEIGRDGHMQFLEAASGNMLSKYIHDTMQDWEKDQLEIISKNQIAADDIPLGSLIRKAALISFIPEFTSDFEESIKIINEIDEYEAASSVAANKILAQIIVKQEEEIKLKNELYTYAQKFVKMGNWEWDVTTDKMKWSAGMHEIFGVKEGVPLSTADITKLVHPEDKGVIDIANQAIKDKHGYEVNYRVILPNGSVKHINSKGTVAEISNGSVTKMKGILRDVTEQAEVDNKLRDYSAFIRKVADTTPSLITSFNKNTGEYIFINRSLKNILGYDMESISEKGVSFFVDKIHSDDIEYYHQQQKLLIEESNENYEEDKEQIVEYKYRVLNKEGKYRWLHTYTTVFDRDKDGNVLHLLNLSNDITDQVVAEQVLYQKNLQLQQSNSSLQEFAYVASHDLKEPLRKITTFGDRLSLKLKDVITDDAALYLNKITDAAHRMQVMINDLMSVSTITGDKNYEIYDLDDILADAKVSLEHKIESTNAKIISDDLPEVKVVVAQFRQLFQNLLGNSLKFSKPEVIPEIRITCGKPDKEKLEKYGLNAHNNYIELMFKDNGIGFSNEFNDKIFTIFKRLHGKSEYEGSGIGLAICRKVIENHNGIITASGMPGEGATFCIIMPSLS